MYRHVSEYKLLNKIDKLKAELILKADRNNLKNLKSRGTNLKGLKYIKEIYIILYILV